VSDPRGGAYRRASLASMLRAKWQVPLIKEIGSYEGDARDRSFIFTESGHRLAGGACVFLECEPRDDYEAGAMHTPLLGIFASAQDSEDASSTE
jgi:hypothetical protein